MQKLFYNSRIYSPSNESSVLKASFKLIKQFDCYSKENLDLMVDKLDRLKNEDFNRIHIPDFEYRVKGNTITYDTAFVKGYGVGTLIPEFSNIVYEDIVQRDSDWTFTDYGMPNFIVEYKTDRIFAVDLQSYNFVPDRDYRESIWRKFENLHSDILKGLVNGEWSNPNVEFDC